ncbi:AraC family transcriptional regulator [Paenibacillus roseipurpureus]|uniref:AraC family transcriptional regulator n=1 Tax=Paenibacillus roseopurpureus TaxID=2918901 RepID=A0AA96LJ25_9BACL|nr:AraC family transcriptional regulator [Paenibacillus sp. MBLB1832]WNR42752.1 AraC family transcriptional regulator [Paenibacillus sp. MBLB1832]
MSQVHPPYFEQNKNQSDLRDIDRPFYVGIQDTEQEGYQIASHWHYHMEIIYIAAGKAWITIGNDSFEATAGSFILIHPCEVHSVTIETNQPSRHYVIGFDPELLNPMPQLAFELQYYLPYTTPLHGLHKWIQPEATDLAPLHVLVETMYSEYQDRAFAFELAVSSSIFKLILWLLRYQRTLLSPAFAEDVIDDSVKMAAFRGVLVTINENSHLPITAEEAAKMCMMSYSQFARFFKRMMHTTFTQYVMFIKIRRAEQLLLDPTKSITQIALETGFQTSSYFIKHFKRIKGVSPKRYRKDRLNLEPL